MSLITYNNVLSVGGLDPSSAKAPVNPLYGFEDLASQMLTKEELCLKRGTIILKRCVVSACASATAGLDKASPSDLECTLYRHPCRAESL